MAAAWIVRKNVLLIVKRLIYTYYKLVGLVVKPCMSLYDQMHEVHN